MASLRGHLHLVAARDADGQTYLRRQGFRAPFHLSKPHHDAGALIVNAVNPTAGVFAGDEIEVRAEVESGARLLLTAPSAQRLHAMNGGEATVAQEFRVAGGGFFESWPELLIPQRGARLRQRTTAHVEEGGALLLIETLAPGRVASGECFAFDRLDWTTEIHVGSALVARERYVLTPASLALAAVRRLFPAAYFASIFAVSPRLVADPAWMEAVRALHGPSAWIACSPLAPTGHFIRVVAADSIALRRTVIQVRACLYAALGASPPATRRN